MKYVLVHWQDSASQWSPGGWTFVSQLDEVIARDDMTISTVGKLYHMDDNCVLIVQSTKPGYSNQVYGVFKIPMRAVTEIIALEAGELIYPVEATKKGKR